MLFLRPFIVMSLGLGLITTSIPTPTTGATGPKMLIAHRGASAYAPEHTLPAYELAIAQRADFVEPDLAVSSDGQLVCLHDDTLERTTNVAMVFPERHAGTMNSRGSRSWLANDFTLAELKTLDAGSWFDAKYAGARIPSWDEMLRVVRDHPGVGVYPELKSPPLYTGRGVDMAKLFVDSVKRQGLDRPESLRTTPMIVQSFDEPTIRRMAAELPAIPRVFLTAADADVTDERLKQIALYASGIAPEKNLVLRHPDMVARAHGYGLSVTSWTFRSDDTTAFANVRDEMAHFLFDLDLDALFTNNPDRFPRQR